jgi:phospho-N-acetylmuramoyl-pentapeptide-transferase
LAGLKPGLLPTVLFGFIFGDDKPIKLMLYHLFDYIQSQFDLPGSGLFRFITFRAALAIILSLIITVVFGNSIISLLRRKQVGETIRDLGLEGQNQKQGTPTMGGIIIILAILIPTILLAKLDNVYIQIMILSTVWMAIIGFIDDYIKIFKKNKAGLKGRFKVMGQIGLGLIVGLTMLLHEDVIVRVSIEEAYTKNYKIERIVSALDAKGQMKEMAFVKEPITNIPFIKNNNLNYESFFQGVSDNADILVWLLFIPLVIFIVTAVSNAANITDGLDGLAAGTTAIIAATLALFAFVSGNTVIADYLNIFYIPYSGELVIFSASFFGACVGFLWYNAYPAKVFMGDTGSLTIGGIVAALAIILRKELLIPILCGIYLIENLSVIIQVFYFKYTRMKYGEGRRVFLMAPLHHHYQKQGIHEAKIVTRFWIIGVFLAILSFITLKIR